MNQTHFHTYKTLTEEVTDRYEKFSDLFQAMDQCKGCFEEWEGRCGKVLIPVLNRWREVGRPEITWQDDYTEVLRCSPSPPV